MAAGAVRTAYVAFLAFGGASAGSALVVPVFAAGVIVVRTAGATVPDRLGGRRMLVLAAPIAAAGLLALERVPGASQGAAAGLFFAFFDAGVGAGGPLAGGVARLTSPATALAVAAAGVAASAGVALRRG